MTNDEAAQIAALLNTRNHLTIPYDAAQVLKSAEQYFFRVVEGHVVAAVELKNVQWYQGEVRHLTVHEDFEGQGYARNLFAELERRAAARGFRILQCTIREGNTDSEGFFTKAGFTPVSRFNNKMSGNNVSVWQKVLVPAL
jgi:ribosomal protein S18 acetylase RimI-like enzyme